MKSLLVIPFVLAALCGQVSAQKLKWTAEISVSPNMVDPVFFSDGAGGGVVQAIAGGNLYQYYWFSNKGVLKGSVEIAGSFAPGVPFMISSARFYVVSNAPLLARTLRRYTVKRGGGLDMNPTPLSSAESDSLLLDAADKAIDKTGFAVVSASGGTMVVKKFVH